MFQIIVSFVSYCIICIIVSFVNVFHYKTNITDQMFSLMYHSFSEFSSLYLAKVGTSGLLLQETVLSATFSTSVNLTKPIFN